MKMDKDLNNTFSSEIRDHFPFDQIRPPQEQAMRSIEQAVKENKKFVIMELPTGAGKSPLGVAAGSWAKTLVPKGDSQPGVYYCTPQKSLAIQAMKDFESMGLVELKGKANYHCGYKFEDGTEMSCEDADFFFPEEHGGKGSSGEDGEGSRVSKCNGYKLAKKRFAHTPLGITNFAYYLAETAYAGQLKDRTMLVLDEAHGTEQHILGLASIEITRYRCEEVGIRFESVPFVKADAVGQGVALDWLNETFRPACIETSATLMIEAESLADQKGRQKEAGKLLKKARGLNQFVAQLDMFLKSESSERKKWMVWSESAVDRCPHCGIKQKFSGKTCWKCKGKMPLTPAKMIIKPLTATLFAHKLLFSKAQMVIMMSATILDFDTFLGNLGIDRKDAVCIALPSEFPIETRRILYRPVANMSHQNIEQSLPKLAAEVAALLRKHSNEKGIIHTHTYKITRYLVDYLTRQGFGNRILTHAEGVAGDRERIIQEHIDKVGEPTVLISPSFCEGLDLKDDLSRFGIVVKIPFEFLSDYVKARNALDGGKWYAWTTSLHLQQMTGRSNRHEKDWSTHYILDEAFGFFIQKHGGLFSPWWSEAVMFPGEYKVDWDSSS